MHDLSKKLQRQKDLRGLVVGWGWGDEWVGVGLFQRLTYIRLTLHARRMAHGGRWTYQLGNHTPERSKALHGAGMAIDGRCGLDATGVVFIPQSALQMGNSVAKMSQVCLVNWISVNPPLQSRAGGVINI